MNLQVRPWRQGLRATAFALVLAAIPLPVLAEESTQPVARPSLKASIARAVANSAVAAPQAQHKVATADKSELGTPSFFKKPAGIIVLAVVAAGAGFAAYSASHDRVHSVIRGQGGLE